MGRMNKLTALGWTPPGLRGVPPGRWIGEASRRQRLTGRRNPGGERRHLFGAGEGPAEALAEAKQDTWNGSTQAEVRNKMRNNDLQFGYPNRCGQRSCRRYSPRPRSSRRVHAARPSRSKCPPLKSWGHKRCHSVSFLGGLSNLFLPS